MSTYSCSMPIVFILVGSALVAAGLFFAVKGIASDKAGADGLKSFSVTGPSWLILIALGVATIVGGSYLWKSHPTPAPAPPEVTDETIVEPFSYGDDLTLDLLYDQCEAGDMRSCDSLYLASPGGSDYELFGGWCGYIVEDPLNGACEDDPNAIVDVGVTDATAG
jgi:hypothetical protein